MNSREGPGVPATALVLHLLAGQIGVAADWQAVGDAWRSDLEAEVHLTYKGGFFLLCQNGNPATDDALVRRTIQYLHCEQHQDGGFGPWKGHPIGSDPWSTGICLVGLCSFPELVDRSVIRRAADWLCRTQLPSGLWPYHFIDEGSAYAYWGLKEAVRVLEGG